MSNSLEFFQPQNSKLAVGSAAASVYLDGQLCDFLFPETITFAANPDFNQAVLSFCPHGLMPSLHDDVRCGQKIDIKTVYDSGIGFVCPEELVIFSGFIEQIEITETAAVIAKDYSAKLKRRTVYGQNISSDDGQ